MNRYVFQRIDAAATAAPKRPFHTPASSAPHSVAEEWLSGGSLGAILAGVCSRLFRCHRPELDMLTLSHWK